MASISVDQTKHGELTLSLVLSPREVSRIAAVLALAVAGSIARKAETPPGRPWVAPSDADA